MRRVTLVSIFVLIAVLVLSGCLGVDGEALQLPVREVEVEVEVQIGHGDLEACMFTIWFFTEPDAPPIGDTKEKCLEILDTMASPQADSLWDEIQKEISGEEEVQPVDCSNANCM